MNKREEIEGEVLEHLWILLSFFPPKRMRKLKKVTLRLEAEDGYAESSFPIEKRRGG